jgi:hypothetical protein
MIVHFIATFHCLLDSCDNVDIRRFSVPGKPHAVISEKISILYTLETIAARAV